MGETRLKLRQHEGVIAGEAWYVTSQGGGNCKVRGRVKGRVVRVEFLTTAWGHRIVDFVRDGDRLVRQDGRRTRIEDEGREYFLEEIWNVNRFTRSNVGGWPF